MKGVGQKVCQVQGTPAVKAREVSGLELSERLWNARGDGVREGRNQVMEELTGQGDEYILS